MKKLCIFVHKSRRKGQVLILAALIIAIVVLAIAYEASRAVNSRQSMRYEPYKEVIENIESSFRAAMAFALANMTGKIVYRGYSLDRARGEAYDYLSKWKEAAMLAYSNIGLQLEFKTNLSEVLQGEKVIAQDLGSYRYEEFIPAWKIYNLSQVYWYRSTGCSAILACLSVNITGYGFYGWKSNILVGCNATIYPGSFSSKVERPPADIVLILDASDRAFSKDDHAFHLEGVVGECDWTTVGTVDLGEMPTDFTATLTAVQGVEFRMRKGSSTAPTLEVRYVSDQVMHTSEIQAVADSYVSSGKKKANFGGGAVRVQSSNGEDCRTWLMFDLSTIPQGSEIESAVLRLYAYDTKNSEDRTYVACHSYFDGWNERDITWENQNQESIGPPAAEARVPSKGWVTFDVTMNVTQDFSTDKLSSWVIMDSKEGDRGMQAIYLDSKETAIAEGLSELYPDGGSISSSECGEWMVQVRNRVQDQEAYSVDIYARKLDQIRNAVATFIKLLNPEIDRVAIVQYGPGSNRSPNYLYYASSVTMYKKGQTNYYFYGSGDQELLVRLNQGTDTVGYGFEKIGNTVYYGGNSPIGAAIENAIEIFKQDARDGSERMIVLVSASKEDVDPGGLNESAKYSLERDLTGKALSECGAVTYAIGFGDEVDGVALKELAERGGGTYLSAVNGRELRSALASIAYQLNDRLTFNFELKQENGAAVNYLTPSSIQVYIMDDASIRHRAELESFSYMGGGNFTVKVSMAGCQTPNVVEVVVMDPRGIVVVLHVPLEAWRKEAG